MIDKKLFVTLISEIQAHDVQLDKYDILQFDHPFIAFGYSMFDRLLRIYFTQEGIDWINWYLWERSTNKYYWENGKRYEVSDTNDLWELVKTYARTYN